MEAKWASLVSYGMSLDALKDFLPLDVTLDVKTVRYDTLKVAKRLEAELGMNNLALLQAAPVIGTSYPLSDGNDTLRELRLAMSPQATHILDWIHLTMKLT